MNAAQLRETFGGSWDVGAREVWGLVHRGERALKIELLHASDWRCSIFERGACIASSRHDHAITAIRTALGMLEP